MEADLENILVDLLNDKRGSAGELATALATVSCRYKHHGFREEAEVRIVAMPTHEDVYKIAYEKGDKRPRKPILFRAVGGLLIPYIALFGRRVDGAVEKLPISKILVGPHPDKLKRQKAVQGLLKQLQVAADVIVSDIPYLGR